MDPPNRIELQTFRLRAGQMPPLPAATAPTFLNSWVDAGGAFEVGGYYKDALGIVRLTGAIKTGAIGSVAFSLPVGYRPRAKLVFSVGSTNAANAAVLAQVQVETGGDVTILAGDNNRVYLDGVQFRAAA